MSKPALTAVTHQWESAVASLLGQSSHAYVAKRCADLAELLGCVAAGQGEIAAVSSDLRGVDASVIAELTRQGVHILGVYRPGDDEGRLQLARWGVQAVIPGDASLAALDEALSLLLTTTRAGGGATADEPLLVPAEWLDADEQDAGEPKEAEVRGLEGPGSEQGKVLVVWGPTGAPGRTSVALNLAAELNAEHGGAMLIDADTYGASLAQMLGLLDEAPGLAAAVRAADQGVLDRDSLARIAAPIESGLVVLTGLPRADRWPEIRPHALLDVIQKSRDCVSWVVIDVAPYLEEDEELSFDTAAPRRNQATLAALEAADEVVVVGAADPVGLQRLVRGLDGIKERTHKSPLVVVNRVRASAVGRDPERKIREILQRFAGVETVSFIPDDPRAYDGALLNGEVLLDSAPKSQAREALSLLANDVAGVPPPQVRNRRAKG